MISETGTVSCLSIDTGFLHGQFTHHKAILIAPNRIHALEEDLGELEQVHCDLKIANDTILAKRTIEEYDRKVSNSVELHKRNVLAEYQRASRAASKAASVMVADRSILGELASVAQTAASPTLFVCLLLTCHFSDC